MVGGLSCGNPEFGIFFSLPISLNLSVQKETLLFIAAQLCVGGTFLSYICSENKTIVRS